MESRSADMQAIFNELSDTNKDIVILVAKSMKIAQEVTEQTREPPIPRCVHSNDRRERQFM